MIEKFLYIKVSSILEKQGKTEIGQQLSKSFLSPSLKIEVTFAVFKSSEKTLSPKDNLKICSKVLLTDPKQFLITLKLVSS